MRILVGGIVQESNTFSPARSTMDNFRDHVFVTGDEMRELKISNEINGFCQAADDEHVDYVPLLFGQAVSSGIFTDKAFQELKETVIERIRGQLSFDGVFFALHGAMVAEHCDDVEGELLTLIRKEIGNETPIVISLDLHANVTNKMIRQVQGVVGYRTFPHIDFYETGYRAAKLLFSIVQEDLKLEIVLRKIPMIVPAENGQTAHGPLAELWQEAEIGEQKGDSLVTSIFPVQPWLDVDELGFSIVVAGKDREKAIFEAERLAWLAWDKRHQFDVELINLADILAKALHRSPSGEPLIISDSADSPGAGSTGDSNVVLKELLGSGIGNDLTCLLSIVDAPAVSEAIRAGVGEIVDLTVGFTLNPNREHGKPLSVRGQVIRIGDGRFTFQSGYAKGTEGNMGRCVVFQTGKIYLLISEKPTFTGDPNMYRSMGLEPSGADFVMVKSANQFRADYEQISSSIYIVNTPGYSSADLKSLHFSKMKRPFYPFDEDFNWR